MHFASATNEDGTHPSGVRCDYLFSRLYRGEGVFHTSVDAGTYAPRDSFSLYEHAFYLFALAWLQADGASRYPVAATARSCLEWLCAHFAKRNGGFEDSLPPCQSLKSNPHMHLLEAALAWIDVSDASSRQPWVDSPFFTLEAGVADYVGGYLAHTDSYR
ncbi:MAG TPA: AGE family epimerase/isomerase [Steroidobacteraceae bacterium]|jgi:mannose-6-phosphate isomerase